jgi:hypothetical protein
VNVNRHVEIFDSLPSTCGHQAPVGINGRKMADPGEPWERTTAEGNRLRRPREA